MSKFKQKHFAKSPIKKMPVIDVGPYTFYGSKETLEKINKLFEEEFWKQQGNDRNNSRNQSGQSTTS